MSHLISRSLKRSHDLFVSHHAELPDIDEEIEKKILSIKAYDQYGFIKSLVDDEPKNGSKLSIFNDKTNKSISKELAIINNDNKDIIKNDTLNNETNSKNKNEIVLSSVSIIPKRQVQISKPEWHAPWKLMRVISGHTGWVRCLAVDPSNDWFATGSNDRIIKIWDLASGKLRLSLTGHISAVRDLEVSNRHAYLFSCGEDKTVKCWDLEYNKVIRSYHGHLSGVYSLSLHPMVDVLVTGGRDTYARLWDMRTKTQIHALTGHTNTVSSVKCQAAEPQIITGSHDYTIRLWDIIAGKTMTTLTHHKKSVRALEIHPTLYMFASGAVDNIKQWVCPEGKFVQNLEGHNSIVNCLTINSENVLVSGGDNGSMYFYDWKSGYNFQRTQSTAQSGSIDSEAGVFAMTFDVSGTRLITAEADKTIKVYKEDEEASIETHPINWKPNLFKKDRY